LTALQKKRWINSGRLVVDVSVSIALFLMLSLWGAKYLIAGEPFLLKIEAWIGSDKPMHFTLGFLLPLCIGWLIRLYRRQRRQQIGFFVLIALLYALDETMQSFLPYRSSTWSDFQMSMTGWSLAVVVWYCLWQLLFLPTRQR
jgi:uncharacterized membrane protein YjdF